MTSKWYQRLLPLLFQSDIYASPSFKRSYAAISLVSVGPVLVSGLWVLLGSSLPPVPVFLAVILLSVLLGVTILTHITKLAVGSAKGDSLADGLAMWLPSLIITSILASYASRVLSLSFTLWTILINSGVGILILIISGFIAVVTSAAVARRSIHSETYTQSFGRAFKTAIRSPLKVIGTLFIFLVTLVAAVFLGGLAVNLVSLLIIQPFLQLAISASVEGFLIGGAICIFVSRSASLSKTDAPGEMAEAPKISLKTATIAVGVCLLIALVSVPFAPAFSLIPSLSVSLDSIFTGKEAVQQGNYQYASDVVQTGLAAADSALALMGTADSDGTAQAMLNEAYYADPGYGRYSFAAAVQSYAQGDQKGSLEYAEGAITSGDPEGYLIFAKESSGREAQNYIFQALSSEPYLALYAPGIPVKIPVDGYKSQVNLFKMLRDYNRQVGIYAANSAIQSGQEALGYTLIYPLANVPNGSNMPYVQNNGDATDGMANAVLGVACLALGDPSGADHALSQAIQDTPGDASWLTPSETLLLSASVFTPYRNSDSIQRALQDAGGPDASPDLVLAAGSYEIAQKNWQQAILYFSYVSFCSSIFHGGDIPNDQYTTMAGAETALAYYEEKNDNAAEAVANNVLDNDPSTSAAAICALRAWQYVRCS